MKNRYIILSMLICCLLCGCGSAGTRTKAMPSVEVEIQADTESSDAAEIIKDIATVQAFTDEEVDEEDINAIVMAGINSPSSMNGQPWHFSVVTDTEVLQELGSGMSFGKPSEGSGDFAPLGTPEGGFGEFAPPEGDFPGEMPEGFDGKKPGDFGGKTPENGKPEGAPTGMPAAPGGSGAKAGIGDAPLVIIISCKSGSELDAGLATQNMSAEAQLLGYGTKIISSPTIALNGTKQAEYKEVFGIPEEMAAVCVLLVGRTDIENLDAVSGATERNSVDDLVTFVR